MMGGFIYQWSRGGTKISWQELKQYSFETFHLSDMDSKNALVTCIFYTRIDFYTTTNGLGVPSNVLLTVVESR